ncbi:MAG: LPP20 family lipoprotein [Treponema sp.]|nr:LPP20 family lipoprotein [Treponema sp.]
MKFKILVFLFLGIFTHVLFAQSLANSQAAADDATRRLEEALRGGSAASGNTQNAPAAQVTRGGERPAWVINPYATLSQDHYVAAVGYASNRAEAERRALANLVVFFGISIDTRLEVTSIYSEAVNNGLISSSENTHVNDTIATAASLNNLIGAQVVSVWDDGRGTVNVLAYIEKERTAVIYTQLIRLNQSNIENLTRMSNAEKNTFTGLQRFRLAVILAGINAEYAGIVSLVGGSTVSLNITTADSLNLEIQNIIRNISVGFSITGDSNNRVRDAFARVLNSEGLRTQGSNTPYVLEISINMAEAVFPNNNFIFCRFTVNANLVERATGSVILSFTITDREGHTTYEEAQARSYLRIERMITESYPGLLREYLAALMPQ